MKHNLLVASMMALTLGSGSFAHAEITVSGAQTYMLKFYSGGQDVNATTTGNSDEHKVVRTVEQIPSQSELVVKGETVSDEGLIFGGEVQVRTASNLATGEVFTDEALTDEAFLYVGGASWGRVVLGHDDDALDRLAVHGGSVLAGLEGEWEGTESSINGKRSIDGKDEARIVYLSPLWGGFRGGVSFTPTKTTESLFTNGSNEGSGENGLALAGSYEGGVLGFYYRVGGGLRHETVFNRSRTVASDSKLIATTESVGDVWGYQLGMMSAYKRYSFSMGYGVKSTNRKEKVFAEDAVETDYQDSFLSFGVRYEYRKGGISVGYNVQNRTSNANIATNFSGSSTLLDLDYKMGEGLVLILSSSLNASDSDSLDSENDSSNRSEAIFGFGVKALF